MGGGGSDQSVLSQVTGGLNAATKFISGYDAKTGDWSTHGSQWQMLDEGFGAIDGRNSSRAALSQARDQFNLSQKQAQDLVNQNNWNKQQSAMTASSSAAAATATARVTSGVNSNNATPLGMGSSGLGGTPNAPKDFLGL